MFGIINASGAQSIVEAAAVTTKPQALLRCRLIEKRKVAVNENCTAIKENALITVLEARWVSFWAPKD